jgi:phosphoadenosine phosphosulfate reductase
MSYQIDLDEINTRFEGESPGEILKWAWRTFKSGKIAATSSFQSQSLPLLHLISTHTPELPVLFIDTGFHFPQTLAFRDRLARELGLNIRILKPGESPNRFKWQHGELYHSNPDLCCYLNKVKPLQEAKKGLDAWVTGIRRDQTQMRADTPVVSIDEDGVYKICPMATWKREEIWSYIQERDLSTHPLLTQGYLSIGCAPCTRPVFSGEDERDGRWLGQLKTECGLHIHLKDERVDS